jgi:hypothetical protein
VSTSTGSHRPAAPVPPAVRLGPSGRGPCLDAGQHGDKLVLVCHTGPNQRNR